MQLFNKRKNFKCLHFKCKYLLEVQFRSAKATNEIRTRHTHTQTYSRTLT